MATTAKKPAKKAVVKKRAAKKSPAKKVAAKKVAPKKDDERGKKLSSVSFDIYENGISVNGKTNVKTLIDIHGIVGEMINNAISKNMAEALGTMTKKVPVKKGK